MNNLSGFSRHGEIVEHQGRKQIMQIIIRSPGGLLEEVVLECPGLTWNQVFCELDRMSRAGASSSHSQGTRTV